MRYILFLRGINVGGKNKVSMQELKESMSEIGFTSVSSYINSGNICFSTDFEVEEINLLLKKMFEKEYAFSIEYSIILETDYKSEFSDLPEWWLGVVILVKFILNFPVFS